MLTSAERTYLHPRLAVRGAEPAVDGQVRADVEAASDREVQRRFHGTAWLACDSWYRDASGRIVTNWPGYMTEYERATKQLDPSEYEFL